MAGYTVQDLETDLQGVIHGTTLNQVQNLQGIVNRAARQLLLDIDPQETKRLQQLPQVFEQVYLYACPTDLKGQKIFDIKPQTPRQSYDVYPQAYSQEFSLGTNLSLQNMFNVDFNTGIKTLQINSNFLTAPIVINTASDTDSNGTWTAGGGATGLVDNNTNYIANGGSLQFNLSAGQSTGYLENSTMNSVDLSGQVNQSTLFLWVYLPAASSITNVKLRWGSSATAYYEVTATQAQNNTAFVNGWNLIPFTWNGASVTGSPSSSAITYLRVTWTYDSTLQTAVGLNLIESTIGTILVVGYYSKYLFRNVAGTWIEKTTDPSDSINLDVESYNLLFNLVAYLTTQQLQGLDAQFGDASFFLGAYNQGVARYKSMYKSEVQLPQSSYYTPPQPSYSKYLNGRNRP